MYRRFPLWALSPCLVSLFGTLALVAAYLSPAAGDDVTALVLAPGVSGAGAMDDVVALGLPIRDIRWGGQLIELDVTSLPESERTRLTDRIASAAMQIAVRPTALCVNSTQQRDAR